MPSGQGGRKPQPLRDPDAYRIGIICALGVEMNAVQSCFDHFFLAPDERPPTVSGDQNSYSFGTIGEHHVVLAGIGGTGNVRATDVAKDMDRSFQRIALCLVVGICGVIPLSSDKEVLLGDVVLSKEVVYYTKGKHYPSGHRTEDMLGQASKAVTRGFEQLCSHKPWKAFYDSVHQYLRDLMKHPSITELAYKYPGRGTDALYDVDYLHEHRDGNCEDCRLRRYCPTAVDSSCQELGCSPARLVDREHTSNVIAVITTATASADRTGYSVTPLGPDRSTTSLHLDSFLPHIHIGKMASGDVVLKDGRMRDTVAHQHKVLGFEMEGAGVSFTFPTVVIKAGYDYADSHKNKQW